MSLLEKSTGADKRTTVDLASEPLKVADIINFKPRGFKFLCQLSSGVFASSYPGSEIPDSKEQIKSAELILAVAKERIPADLKLKDKAAVEAFINKLPDEDCVWMVKVTALTKRKSSWLD